MPADRRIGGVRQAEFDHGGAPAPRPLRRFDQRQKPVHQQRQDFVAAQLRRPRAADQPRAAAQHRHRNPFRRILRQQPLLGVSTLLQQLR